MSRDKCIRMLQLVTQMELGGAQKIMLEVCHGLDRAKYDVRAGVLYTKNQLNPLPARYGIEVIDFRMKRFDTGSSRLNPLRVAGGFRRLVRYLQRERIQVLQSYTYYANIVAVAAGIFARVPVIVISQRNSYHTLPGWKLWMDSLAASKAHAIISVCEATRQFSIMQERFPARRMITIRNGIDLTWWRSKARRAEIRREFDLQADTCVIGTSARLLPKKGIRYLLEAVARLPARNALECWIIGDGRQRGELEKTAERCGISLQTRFFGWRPDNERLLEALDIFVLPSLEEGFPNVILEAMAKGLPVVATDVDGNSEAVVEGATGYLIPPADTEALAERLEDLVRNPELREQFGAAGLHRIEKWFTYQRMISRYQRVYDTLCRMKGISSV